MKALDPHERLRQIAIQAEELCYVQNICRESQMKYSNRVSSSQMAMLIAIAIAERLDGLHVTASALAAEIDADG